MIIVVNQGKGNNKNNNNDDDERNMNNPDQFRSIMDRCQHNSPLVWGETYNEYIKYITAMTEIY